MDLFFGNCLEVMGRLADASVDLILADLPYGTTACAWDTVIPFEPLWAHYRRLLRPGGAVILTACQPFSTAVINSNPKWFRYELIWDKVLSTGFLDANRRPLRRHELVLFFSPKAPPYYPQLVPGEPYSATRKGCVMPTLGPKKATAEDRHTVNTGSRHPTSILRFPNARSKKVHPTQKPLALFDWLVRSYSKPGQVVLDNTMGSGTTGEAALRAGRAFIGIEQDPQYYNLAVARLSDLCPESLEAA